ncbi:MAG: DJ-1/PfpI family protein [Candidatus Odinarchaeota archaeon]
MKKSIKSVLLIFSLLSINSGIFLIPVRAYTPGHKVMILVAFGVGETYFPVKGKFESWGWEVTTAGLTSSIISCPNVNPRPVPIDILISEINNDTLSQYECIFIPSGGHWNALAYDATTLTTILNAYNLGLVISSLCIGIVVIARADIVNGVRIAYDSNSASYVISYGGITVSKEVVTDQRIVTGGTGGGPTGGGASQAPTIEVCKAIANLIAPRSLPLSIAIIGITTGALVGLVWYYKRKERKR